MARSEIWIQEEYQVNILPLSPPATVIHSGIAARKRDMKAFSFPSSVFSSAGASHASSRLPSLIFSLLFLPSCPHSIHFHFPLSSFYSCFHFNPISQSSPAPLSCSPLSLFTSSLTSSVSLPTPVCHLSRSSFNLQFFIFPPTAPNPDFLLFHWHILSVSLSFFRTRLPFRFLQKPSTDQLGSLAWCLSQPYTLGRLDSSSGSRVHADTHAHKMDLLMWPGNMSHFYKKCVSSGSLTHPKSLIHTRSQMERPGLQ